MCRLLLFRCTWHTRRALTLSATLLCDRVLWHCCVILSCAAVSPKPLSPELYACLDEHFNGKRASAPSQPKQPKKPRQLQSKATPVIDGAPGELKIDFSLNTELIESQPRGRLQCHTSLSTGITVLRLVPGEFPPAHRLPCHHLLYAGPCSDFAGIARMMQLRVFLCMCLINQSVSTCVSSQFVGSNQYCPDEFLI